MSCVEILIFGRYEDLTIQRFIFFKDWVICTEELKDQESWNLKRIEKEKKLSVSI